MTAVAAKRPTKRSAAPKAASAAKKKTPQKREKKRHLDGKLEFKTKEMLGYHLELKACKAEGLIKSFLVPTIDNIEKNKYSAVKCEIDGHTFDSMMESRYYIHLLKEKEAGNVTDIELQPPFVLQENFRKNGKAVRKIEYKADFLVTDKNNDTTIYDVKGQITDVFALKRKMFDFKFPDLILKCVQYVGKTKTWIEL